MDDVEDLLAAGALSGQDGAWGEDLGMARGAGYDVGFSKEATDQGGGRSVFTIEPIDCTPDGTGVADKLGWVTTPLGAGLTVAPMVAAGSDEERGLLSDRSTGSVWSSAAEG